MALEPFHLRRVALAALAAISVAACVRGVPLAGHACTCSPGYTCCVVTNQCLPEGTACPLPDASAADHAVDVARAKDAPSEPGREAIADAPAAEPGQDTRNDATPLDLSSDRRPDLGAEDALGDATDAGAADADAGCVVPADARPALAAGWHALSTSGAPSPRLGHTAVWTGTEMIVWGGLVSGLRGTAPAGDGARYDPRADIWRPVSTFGAPSPRAGHGAVWLPSTREMMVWGGSAVVDDPGKLYDPVTDTWRSASSDGAPQSRADAVMVTAGHDALIWCGRTIDDTPVQGDGRLYDPVANRWRWMTAIDAPSCATSTAGAWTGREFAVWGGRAPYGDGGIVGAIASDVGALYDIEHDKWRPMKPPSPKARWGHFLAYGAGAVWLWGGVDSETGSYSFVDGGARYDLATDSRAPLPDGASPGPLLNAPAAFFNAGAFACLGELVTWGGSVPSGVGITSTGAGEAFFPSLGRWAPLASDGAPTPRSEHTLVSTGDSFIVWGGNDASGLTGNGAMYVLTAP